MPKIIENLEARLIDQARQLAQTQGYQAITIRAVAAGCGVGVGTVYNYFPSKEALLSAYLLSEWQQCVGRFQQACSAAESPRDAMLSIYQEMLRFGQQHQSIVYCPEAIAAFVTPQGAYHTLLIDQFSQSLRRFCRDDFSSKFIAHALLGYTLSEYAFEDIYPMLIKLF